MQHLLKQISDHTPSHEIVLNAKALPHLIKFNTALHEAAPGAVPVLEGPPPEKLVLLLSGAQPHVNRCLCSTFARDQDRTCYEIQHSFFSVPVYDPIEADLIILRAILHGKLLVIMDAASLFAKTHALISKPQQEAAANAMHFVKRMHHYRLPLIVCAPSAAPLRTSFKGRVMGNIVCT